MPCAAAVAGVACDTSAVVAAPLAVVFPFCNPLTVLRGVFNAVLPPAAAGAGALGKVAPMVPAGLAAAAAPGGDAEVSGG